MKIYKLDYAGKNMEIEGINIPNSSPIPYSVGKIVESLPLQEYKVYKKGRYSDFIEFGTAIPIFSTRALEAVKDLIAENVQLLDMKIIDSDVECKILNVLNIEGAVDYSRSITLKVGNKYLVDFIKIVFFEEKVRNQHIFKTPDLMTKVYVSEEFRDRILSAKPKLKGIEFHEVWDSSFTIEMELAQKEKYETILHNIEHSTAKRYTFTEVIEQMQQGNAFAYKDIKLQMEPPGKLHILRLEHDCTYSDQSPGYIPPVLLDYMWVEVERE